MIAAEPPKLYEHQRYIQGRIIGRRIGRDGETVWEEDLRTLPVEIPAYDPASGQARPVVDYNPAPAPKPWTATREPTFASMARLLQKCDPNPRPRFGAEGWDLPDELNEGIDELEQLLPTSRGIKAVLELARANKLIKTRSKVRCLFDPGLIHVAYPPRACEWPDLVPLIRRFVQGDLGVHGDIKDVELDADLRHCPVAPFGSPLIEAACVLAGDPTFVIEGRYVAVNATNRGPRDVVITCRLNAQTAINFR